VLLESGATAKFDENYIRESIVNPNAKVVRGYPAVMPTYRGQLSEEQILQLIAYIRSLTPGQGQ
jgi:cytochrome c oxidase subunit 2